MTEVSKKRTVFWTRLFSWLLVGCFTPIAVFSYKFGLFKQATPAYDELGNTIVRENLALNGWGIVSCLLIGSFIIAILKEVAASYTGYSLIKQCYTGLCKTMPFIIAYFVMYFLNNVISQVMFCLMVLILCTLFQNLYCIMPKTIAFLNRN